MAACSVEIQGSRHHYRPGEAIQGEVVVQVAEPTDCRGLTVATQYRTEGAVDPYASEPRARRLFEGHWSPGEHRYPFELPVPPGPATYRGSSLQVMHWLVARADLARTQDPVAERRFAVGAQDVSGYDAGPGAASAAIGPRERAGADPTPAARIVQGTLVCLAGFGMCVLMLTLASAEGLGSGLGTAAWRALGLLIGPIVLYGVLRRVWFSKGLGRPEASLEPVVVRAGESTTLRVAFRVPRRLALTRALVDLECTELAVKQGSKSSSIRRQTVCRRELPLNVPHEVAAGAAIERSLVIPIPWDAPPSFAAPKALVTWMVGVHVAAGRARYVTVLLPLTVRPAPRGRTARPALTVPRGAA
jgi:hypothetical protein